MKCSHCGHPVAVRSRNCGNCGAPHEVTVRHQLELDAKFGGVLRKWVTKLTKPVTTYAERTYQIERLEMLLRVLRGDLQRMSLDMDPYTTRVVMQALGTMVREYHIDTLLVDVIDLLKDERFDAEHTRVMDQSARG